MARVTFFSFHYQDVESFRVNVVRNSSLFKKAGDASRVIDGSLWEAAKLRSAKDLQSLIDTSLTGTSTTAVLIGTETHERPWVKYELVRSFVRGNVLLGIHLNRILEADTRRITAKGLNPLDRLAVYVPDDYKTLTFLELVDGRWRVFAPIPSIANRTSNAVYFMPSWRHRFGFNVPDTERRIKFSALFSTYCWKDEDGYHHLADWIEAAHDRRTYSL